MEHHVKINYQAPIAGIITDCYIEHDVISLLTLKPNFFENRLKYAFELIEECANANWHYKLRDVTNIYLEDIYK